MGQIVGAHIAGIPVEETLLTGFPAVAIIAGIVLQRLTVRVKAICRLLFRRPS